MAIKTLRDEVLETVSHSIYFNACSIGPMPKTTGEKLAEFVRYKQNLPVDYVQVFGNTIQPTREKIGKLIGASADEIAFCGNVSQAITIAAWSIPFEEGDNVIFIDREFPSNVYPWIGMGKQKKVEPRIIPNDGGGLTVERLNQYADARTKAVTVSSVEFSDGYRTDLKAIGNWCKEHNVYFVVDTAQSLGVLPINVEECDIDFLAGVAAKWMLSAYGTGFLYVRKDLIQKTEPPFMALDSMDKESDSLDFTPVFKPTAARFETGATNLYGIYSLGVTIDVCNEIGYENIYQQAQSVADHFTEGLLHVNGVKVADCALKDATRSTIISFITKDNDMVCKYLNEHNVSCVTRDKYIRMGIHGYNTKEEADQVCAYLKEVL